MTDEEYVRAAWEHIEIKEYPNSHPFWIFMGADGCVGPFKEIGEAWSAARKYTEAYAEKIRQVREEIQSLIEVSRSYCASAMVIQNRTISRLQAVLEDLLKGWRQ